MKCEIIFFIVGIAVRSLIFATLWIILGKRVWFFPNILAEEATLSELFQFWPTKDDGERPKWTARLTYAIVAVLVILLLRHHAPDEAARARYSSLALRHSSSINLALLSTSRQFLLLYQLFSDEVL